MSETPEPVPQPEPGPLPDPNQPWFQQLPSKVNYEVQGSPVTAAEVADGGPDAVEAAEAATDAQAEPQAKSSPKKK